MTTPSVNKETLPPTGYTPIPGTPIRPQTASNIPQAGSNRLLNGSGHDGASTPLAKGDEVNPRRLIGSESSSSAEIPTSVTAKQFPPYVAGQTAVGRDQMTMVGGKFVKASSVYPQQVVNCNTSTSRNSPIPHSPMVMQQNPGTPQQVTTSHSAAAGVSHSTGSHESIATPKAKLDFQEEAVSQSNRSKGNSYADKLLKFARVESSNQHQGQLHKTKASKFYQFVDLTSNNEGTDAVRNDRINTKNHTATSCKEDHLDNVRMEYNQTPPPLFDSADSECTVIPESPMKPSQDNAEELPSNNTHNASGRTAGMSRMKKRKLEDATEQFVQQDIESDVVTKIKSKIGLDSASSIMNKACDKDDVKLESGTLNEVEGESAGGNTRRKRRLSRRKSGESDVKMECVEEKQGLTQISYL